MKKLPLPHTRCECPLWVKSGHDGSNLQCPLYPQKRTSVEAVGMSALCQKQTFCTAARMLLFDHLVSAQQRRCRHTQSERLGALEIKHELEFRSPFEGQVGGMGALENPVHEKADMAI